LHLLLRKIWIRIVNLSIHLLLLLLLLINRILLKLHKLIIYLLLLRRKLLLDERISSLNWHLLSRVIWHHHLLVLLLRISSRLLYGINTTLNELRICRYHHLMLHIHLVRNYLMILLELLLSLLLLKLLLLLLLLL
jgi:hypothetical protein